MILIKDNHHKLITNLKESVNTARDKIDSNKKIELEVDSLESALNAVDLDVDIILLDNMTPEDISKFILKLFDCFQVGPWL